MRHKKNGAVITVAFGIVFCIIAAAICVLVVIKNALDKLAYEKAYEKSFLAPFHGVYDVLCEEHSFITSFHEELGAGEYAMYYIECDIAENTDCFAEFVNVQREINILMDARKDDEWFNKFNGHIEIYTDCRRLRVFYHNGSMSNNIWADDVISDEYNVLWDAFPKNEEISLVIFLTDYSDEIKSEITQKYDGRNIIVKEQIGG